MISVRLLAALSAGLLLPFDATAGVGLVRGGRPVSDAPADPVYIHVPSDDGISTLELSEKLSLTGARRMHVILPDVIVCDLPRSTEALDAISHAGAEVRFEHQLSELESASWSISPARIARHLRELQNDRTRLVRTTVTAMRENPDVRITEAREQPVPDTTPTSSPRTKADDRLMHQNSEILAGRVVVQVVFPESDANIEDWTDAARDDAFSRVVAALAGLQDEFKNADITPIYRRVEDAPTSYEPIVMRAQQADEKQWVSDVMARMGYVGMPDEYLQSVHRFNNDGRNQYKADWAFTVFVVNAQRDSDHMFAQARTIGWGYIGGPHIVTPYPAGYLGSSMYVLIKREIGHVFWALDEQLSSEHTCGHRSGYLNGDNGNRTTAIDDIGGPLGCRPGIVPEGCIMNSMDAYDYGADSFCPHSRVMMGVSDRDDNNVPDAFDAAPRVKFSSAAAETLVGETPVLRFQAVAEPIPNTNSRQPEDQRMDYSVPVKDVAISVQGSPPVFFPPSDGAADELVEDFAVRLPPLPPGMSAIDITTRNVYGAKSIIQRKSIFLISLDFFNFFVDYERTGLRVSWSMRGETFDASISLGRRNLETGEDVIVASGLQPTGPPRNEITPYSGFDRTAVPGVEYQYYVKGNFDILYKGAVTPFEFQSNPVAVIGPFARTDLLSTPAPNPFADRTFVSVSVPETFRQAQGASYEIRVPTTVTVAVYDVAGRRVKEIYRDNVFETVVTVGWDGTDERGGRAPFGVYFILAEAGENSGFKKVILVR